MKKKLLVAVVVLTARGVLRGGGRRRWGAAGASDIERSLVVFVPRVRARSQHGLPAVHRQTARVIIVALVTIILKLSQCNMIAQKLYAVKNLSARAGSVF